MTDMPDDLIETPGLGIAVDVLTDILGSLRLTGGVVIDADTAGDFCLESQFTDADCGELLPGGAGDLVAYHYVRSGHVYASIDGLPAVEANAGDIILLPRNDKHLVFSRAGLPPVDSHDLVDQSSDGPAKIVIDGPGDHTTLYCGFLGVSGEHHPLLDSLPPILKLGGGDDVREDWLESSMRLMNEGRHSPEIVARLAELFLAEAIRRYVDRMPPGEGGWLAGLRDPAVARALGIIHGRFAEELDVELLARESGVSRSVLGERFVKLIGEPPMRYCARWRMRMAANMLRDGKDNTANIAYSVGFNSEAAFNRAFKREYGEPPATWRRRIEGERSQLGAGRLAPLPDQELRYCTAQDGTRLAWSAVGEGAPVVKTANWLNHLEFDWSSPLWRHWMRELLQGHMLVRYDQRANGLSDWNPAELSFESLVDDLESVVDCAGLDQFDLLGISQGAAVAIAYSIRHPERVRKLILYGGYAVGWAHRGDVEEKARREAMVTLTDVGWGADNPAYRQLFTQLYIPGASPAQTQWFNEVQRQSASPENAVKIQRLLSQIDVRPLLDKVSVPTLVVHARGDQVVPFAAGEYLAAEIPGARFVPIEGENHILLENEPAWPAFTHAMREFLRDGGDVPSVVPAPKDEVHVRSCRARDGTRIAYAERGSGFPIVKAPVFMTHVEMDRHHPVYRYWSEAGAEIGRFVHMDMRGFGKSEWDPPSFTFEDMVGDLESVVDACALEQFDLVGISHGAAIAMAYAARHPERVRKLVLLNSFACGWRLRADPDEIAFRESLLQLNREKWAKRRTALGEMFITLYFPSAPRNLIDWYNEHLAEISNQHNIERMIMLAGNIDVREELARIRAPTLIFHSRDDPGVVQAVGEEVAAGIAGARFVPLNSGNHVLIGDEPAWAKFVSEFRKFLLSNEK